MIVLVVYSNCSSNTYPLLQQFNLIILKIRQILGKKIYRQINSNAYFQICRLGGGGLQGPHVRVMAQSKRCG